MMPPPAPWHGLEYDLSGCRVAANILNQNQESQGADKR